MAFDQIFSRWITNVYNQGIHISTVPNELYYMNILKITRSMKTYWEPSLYVNCLVSLKTSASSIWKNKCIYESIEEKNLYWHIPVIQEMLKPLYLNRNKKAMPAEDNMLPNTRTLPSPTYS